ncbi:MAG: hypothetical protein JWP72_115, partial [Massilia sp.]|nr:hypothetical protein [Massilia sp.]
MDGKTVHPAHQRIIDSHTFCRRLAETG